MHPVRKQRLLVVIFIVVFSTLAVGLVTYGLRGNINLFFPPAEIAAGKAPVGQPIRLGGMVVAGSIQRDPDSLLVRFDSPGPAVFRQQRHRALHYGVHSAYGAGAVGQVARVLVRPALGVLGAGDEVRLFRAQGVVR